MHSLKYVFALFVIVLAIVWAGALLIVPQFFSGMTSTQRYVLAIIMIVYSAFRGLRIYKEYTNSKLKQDEEN